MDSFDVAIIGSGPGGSAAATLLAKGGMKVALIEDRGWGGTCLNRGCVPTKLLLGAVVPIDIMNKLAKRRIIEGEERINFAALREKVHRFVDGSRRSLALKLIHLGVHLFKGHASCLDPNTIAITERDGHEHRIKCTYIIFACGTRTSTYPGLKPDNKVILSSTSILRQRVIPESLIIAGGGTVGVELADFFFHMGSRIIIAEAAEQLAPTEDEDIAMQLRMSLEYRGIVCLTGVRATSLVRNQDDQAQLSLADGAVFTAEKGLIAAGRMPNTDGLAADNAGCALNRKGFITTDYYLRSSDNSWAIGDVNGKILLAHAATHQGEYVARTLLGKESAAYVPGPCPSCFHGSEEIMRVGMTEREATALGEEVYISKATFSANVIAQAAGNPYGFVKVVWANDEIVGIAAIGHGVSQLTLSAQLLLLGQYHSQKLDTFMVAHPTLDETLITAVQAKRQLSNYCW